MKVEIDDHGRIVIPEEVQDRLRIEIGSGLSLAVLSVWRFGARERQSRSRLRLNSEGLPSKSKGSFWSTPGRPPKKSSTLPSTYAPSDKDGPTGTLD